MSVYFRMSDEILETPCARELARSTKGDCCSAMRILCFIKLLNAALYPSKVFIDAQSVSDAFAVPMKQAQRVFDTCISMGVLRAEGRGYNARKWLIECGYLGKYEKTDKPEKTETKPTAPDQTQKSVGSMRLTQLPEPPEPPEGTPEHDEWEKIRMRHSIIYGHDAVYGR